MKLKFENVDVEQCLRSVMERNTKYYQSDFEYDVGSMERIAQTKHPERTPLFWMSRPSGTWCFRERDVFIRDSDAFYTWQFYKDTGHHQVPFLADDLSKPQGGVRLRQPVGSLLPAGDSGAVDLRGGGHWDCPVSPFVFEKLSPTTLPPPQ